MSNVGCLIKVIKVGDELVLKVPASDQPYDVSVFLTEKAGRNAVLKITANKFIVIQHFKQQSVGQ